MSAKENILKKLRDAIPQNDPRKDIVFDSEVLTKKWFCEPKNRIEKIKSMMEMVKTEVYVSTKQKWLNVFVKTLTEKQIPSLLYAPNTLWGQEIDSYWKEHEGLPLLKAFDRDIDEWKEELFNDTPASITGTIGGVAATGGVLLWPNKDEPRSMSLVPHIHFAVLEASKIYSTLYEAMKEQNWADGLPANALLISGPSKTADIEQVLAYGAHGPKEFILFIIEDM